MKNEAVLKFNNHAYFFPNFPQDEVTAFFSDRVYNLGFYFNPSLETNRKDFLKSLKINYKNLTCAKQPHKNKILLARTRHKGKGALNFKDAINGVDGLITQEKNLPLAVFTADCLSVFLFDPKNKVVAIVHCGWKGTYKKISEKAILKMRKSFNTKPENLIVGFGPSIRKCCYEVGKEFKNYFAQDLIRRKNKFYLDLADINLKQMIKNGVNKKNIFDSKICTSCETKEFFSYRREGERTGRMMSLVMLKSA